MAEFIPKPADGSAFVPQPADGSTFVPQPADGSAFVPQPVEEDRPFLEGSIAKELGEGLLSGGLGAVEGVIGLGTTIGDAVAGTDTTTALNQSFQEFKDDMGIDPEGFAGTIGEVTGQFVIPGLGVAGGVAKLSKGVKAATKAKRALTGKEKLVLGAQEVGAMAGVDFVVSNDNNTVIADVFDSLPQDASDLVGETGTNKALLRLAKRAQIGLEGAVIGGSNRCVGWNWNLSWANKKDRHWQRVTTGSV